MRKQPGAWILLLAGAVVLGACAPKPPEAEGGPVRRNVSVQLMEPKPIAVTVKLPVTLRAREEVELRAAIPGVILSLPYEEGMEVPAGVMPPSEWVEADAFLKANPGLSATDDAVLTRNLRHLDGLAAFAHVDDRAARVNFREAQSTYDAATRTLNRVLSYKDSTEAQVDNARTAQVSARANCDRLRQMIQDAYVASPVKGVLRKRLRRAGEYVNGGELLGVVAVLEPLVAELHLPEHHRHAVSQGSEFDIEIQSVLDAAGKPAHVTARVRQIDVVAHPQTHTFRVEADIANPGRKLPAGVFGTTYLVVYRNAEALTVPLSALRLRGEKVSLFVVQEGVAREVKDVRIGRTFQDSAELLGDSVKAGQKVVVTGTQLLGDGDPVAVREDPTLKLPAGKGKDARP